MPGDNTRTDCFTAAKPKNKGGGGGKVFYQQY